jgi:dihydropyrimidinase
MSAAPVRYDVAITGAEVVLPPLGVHRVTIAIAGGRVAALLDPATPVDAARTIDARGKLVMPGAIDPHTHFSYEGYRGMPLDALGAHFESESASALVGGVTTVLITYRNAPPYQEIFEEMKQAGERRSRIDFAYSLGITSDEQRAGIPTYYREFGVSSFKFYMAYRGEDAKATGNVYNTYDDGFLYEAMGTIAGIPGAMAMVHPENIDVIARLRRRYQAEGKDGLAMWTASRPDFAEAENVRRALYLGEQAGCPVYIPHLSCRKGVEAVLEHRARRTNPAYIETCPQYLTHTKDSPEGNLAKVNPPLRDPDDQEALWAAIASGDVDTFGTDHCGVRRETKAGDVWAAVPGFPGVATMLPVLLSEGVRRGRVTLLQAAAVVSYNTARIFNLYPRKGTLLPGSDADLAVVDLGLARKVTPALLKSRSDFSLYEGREIVGWPVLTMVRGTVMMSDGEIVGEPGHGRYQTRFTERDADSGRASR